MTQPWQTQEGEKQACRETLVEAIRTHLAKPADFFVLPSEDAHDVYMLKDAWPKSRIQGVERDPEVCRIIRERHTDVLVSRMTVTDYLRREREHPSGQLFDAAFLDYTGWLSHQNLQDVVQFACLLAKPKFILGLTFMKNARKARAEVEQTVLNHSCLDDDDLEAVEDLGAANWNRPIYIADTVCAAIERAVGGDLQTLSILDAREYRAGEKSAEMFFAVILVERFCPK
jgi:uncharacterized protein (DUF2132 family)